MMYDMTYFYRGGNDRRDGGYNRSSERKEMFDATCANCGADCKVPFRPNGRKDVFCSKCFGEMNGEGQRGGNRFESRGSDRGFNDRNRYDKPSFRAICDECGDNCEVPFEPRNGKPVLCSDCFAKKDNRGVSKPSINTVDLSEINAKLDRIIKMLSPETPKDITAKILKEIETNSGKEVVPAKKKAKTAKKKTIKE